MRHILKSWSHIKYKCKEARALVLMLDYDGTLTPICSTPQRALLNSKIKKLIVSLKNKKNITVGIITGRALNDIKRLVGIKGIYYAANHGFEIEGSRIKFRHPSFLKYSRYIKQIACALNEATKGIKGVIVENKGSTLSLHYRMVRKNKVAEVKDTFKRVCAGHIKSKRIKVTRGKKVLEVRPPFAWNKAEAFNMIKRIVLSRIKGIKPLSIYIGDDRTDEDVFKIIKGEDISVFVGKTIASKAKYFLNNTKEVGDFLKKLNNLN